MCECACTWFSFFLLLYGASGLTAHKVNGVAIGGHRVVDARRSAVHQLLNQVCAIVYFLKLQQANTVNDIRNALMFDTSHCKCCSCVRGMCGVRLMALGTSQRRKII